ncbi:hypothetical protein H6F46_12125 [Limnothrix sp. FACHB-1083]|uniref:hypothetical protein n=1 Tax=unclassified Limnothrix TaxID=2632864 RepID=UPI001680C98A|nr:MULTISPECIES: hypothetical protein [unclassified Limnothrix]MBD2161438.1 hypothetical protein [Limnothrix sp. FACHB-1083]MBD2192051.1 hypothetical protein [Limnothrix sp. FACHB-1088]
MASYQQTLTPKAELILIKNAQKAGAITGRDWTDCDPVVFFREALGVELTPDQRDIVDHVIARPVTLVPSSHGQGKTWIAAMLLLWGVFCWRGLVISTAPTARQMKELLWRYVRKAWDEHRSVLGGERGQTFLRLDETAQAYGFSSRDTSDTNFQGIHAPRLLIIADEACGISPDVWTGMVSCLTDLDNNRLLAIGNPTRAQTPFALACGKNPRDVIRLAAWRHPNVAPFYQLDSDGVHRLKPGFPVDPTELAKLPAAIPGAITPAWIEARRAEWGESSPRWQARIEATFPTDAAQSVIPRQLLVAARARYDANPAKWRNPRAVSRFGLDVGDGGDDSAMSEWSDSLLVKVDSLPGKGDWEDVPRAAQWLARQIPKGAAVAVDRSGVGAGALGNLRRDGIAACPFDWGGAATDPVQFLNAKAEQFWRLRMAFEKGEAAIAPLGDVEDQLFTEMSAIWWELTAADKIRIEDKGKTRARLGRSPNLADAVVGGHSAPKAVGRIVAGVRPWGLAGF